MSSKKEDFTHFYNWSLPTSLEYANKPQDLSTWLLHTNKYVRTIDWDSQSLGTYSKRYAPVKEKDWEDML
jgi:hypothetical protein